MDSPKTMEAKQKLELIFDKSSDIIMIIDIETGQIVDINDTIMKILGFRPSSLIGKQYTTFLAQENTEMDLEIDVFDQIVQSRPFKAINNMICYLDVAYSQIKWNDKDAFLVTLRDVTERTRAIQHLHNQKNWFEALLADYPDGSIIVDEKFTIQYYNRVARNLFSLPLREELSFRIIFEQFDRGIEFQEAMQKKSFSNLKLETIDKKMYSINCSTVVFNKEDFKILTFRDITKDYEIDLIKNNFVSNVSHELRTPITSILAFADTLLKRENIEIATKEKFLRIIRDESQRLSDLIDDLLSISQIEAKKIKFKFETVPLKSTIFEVVELFKKANNIILKDFPPKELYLRADRNSFKRILINIITNSIKFSEENDPIEISVKESENMLKIYVKDYGVGMPKADLDHVFEKFYRVYRPGASFKGAGLGLYIVKELMDAHGANIRVKSEENEGTEAILEFPKQIN